MPDADPCNEVQSTRQVDKNVWLYNINNDPSECVDLTDSHPHKVIELLERLAFYNSTSVTVNFPPTDPDHGPDNTGGAWVPWVYDEVK